MKHVATIEKDLDTLYGSECTKSLHAPESKTPSKNSEATIGHSVVGNFSFGNHTTAATLSSGLVVGSGIPNESIPSSIHTGGFSFGKSLNAEAMKSSTPQGSNGFAFGGMHSKEKPEHAAVKESSGSSTSFSFGKTSSHIISDALASSSTTTSLSGGSFTFGTSNTEASKSSTMMAGSGGFSFGSSKDPVMKELPASSRGFSFGIPSSHSTTEALKSSTTSPDIGGFRFGGIINAKEPAATADSVKPFSVAPSFSFNLPGASSTTAVPATTPTGALDNEDDETIGREEATVILKVHDEGVSSQHHIYLLIYVCLFQWCSH